MKITISSLSSQNMRMEQNRTVEGGELETGREWAERALARQMEVVGRQGQACL